MSQDFQNKCPKFEPDVQFLERGFCLELRTSSITQHRA